MLHGVIKCDTGEAIRQENYLLLESQKCSETRSHVSLALFIPYLQQLELTCPSDTVTGVPQQQLRYCRIRAQPLMKSKHPTGGALGSSLCQQLSQTPLVFFFFFFFWGGGVGQRWGTPLTIPSKGYIYP